MKKLFDSTDESDAFNHCTKFVCLFVCLKKIWKVVLKEYDLKKKVMNEDVKTVENDR